MQTSERVVSPDFKELTAWGEWRDELQTLLGSLARRGQLVRAVGPEWHHDAGVWVLRAVCWTTDVTAISRSTLPATRGWHPPPVARPARQMTPAQRRAARVVAIAGGVLAVCTGLAWGFLRAASAAGAWAGGHVAQIGFVLVVVAAVAWLFRGFAGSSSRGRVRAGSCPGIVHHCSGCPHH